VEVYANEKLESFLGYPAPPLGVEAAFSLIFRDKAQEVTHSHKGPHPLSLLPSPPISPLTTLPHSSVAPFAPCTPCSRGSPFTPPPPPFPCPRWPAQVRQIFERDRSAGYLGPRMQVVTRRDGERRWMEVVPQLLPGGRCGHLRRQRPPAAAGAIPPALRAPR